MNTQDIAWDDFRTVLAVCREGTLSGAARLLGVNHSTVFRRINALEEKLGVRLFERLPEGYAMTEAGESVRTGGQRPIASLHGTLPAPYENRPMQYPVYSCKHAFHLCLI